MLYTNIFSKILTLALFVLVFTVDSRAEQQPPKDPTYCAKFLPYGSVAQSDSHIICRTAYVIDYDTDAKVAKWSAYTLEPKHTIGCSVRKNSFAVDQSLPKNQRAAIVDYEGSGYDKGHIANDADMSWDDQVQAESFILSNMYPQLPEFNRGIWKVLETNVRAWAWNKKTTLWVIAGGVYQDTKKTIGNNKIPVPTVFWKIIVDTETNETLAFMFPHKANLGSDISKYQTTVKQIESAADIKIDLGQQEDKINDIWASDLKSFEDAKRSNCK